jgi:hypothetical protein
MKILSSLANVIALLVVLVVLQPAYIIAADKKPQGKAAPATKSPANQHYATMRAAFAAKLPKFDAAWRSAIAEVGSRRSGIFLWIE